MNEMASVLILLFIKVQWIPGGIKVPIFIAHHK